MNPKVRKRKGSRLLSATLWTGALVGLAVALGYLAAGALVASRAWRARRVALSSFAIFWLGLGTYGLFDSSWTLASLLGASSLPFAVTVLHVKVAAISAGFGGLVAYLVRVYSGSTPIVYSVGGYYAIVFALLEWHYVRRAPTGQHLGTWGAALDYASASVEPWWTFLLMMLLVPPMIAAIMYGSLLRVTHEPAQRRRIVIVTVSLVLFLAPSLLSWSFGHWFWWGIAEKLLSGLAAAAMLHVALQAWRDGETSGETLAPALDALRQEQRAALAQRARDLV